MQENALWLLKKKAVNKDWNVIMGPYWESLPQQGTLNTKETFPRSSLSLLQDDSMVSCTSRSWLTGSPSRWALPSPLRSAFDGPTQACSGLTWRSIFGSCKTPSAVP